MDIRIGNGYDVHALAPDLPMWLGGVRIPSQTGFVAHSDGDVAIHALCDALLGCLALGDIGHLFPDTSDEWKGVDSKLLLEKVVALVHQHGYAVGNVDITVALQRPARGPLRHPGRKRGPGVRKGHHHRAPGFCGTVRGLSGVGYRPDNQGIAWCATT